MLAYKKSRGEKAKVNFTTTDIKTWNEKIISFYYGFTKIA